VSTAKPIEHRLHTTATVKQMYATAFRCGHPKCRKPLYRMNDASGDLTLNSTVAHIHARRENSPRWNPTMPEAENRSEMNLILLCLEHSSEVDDVPDEYPADVMRSWKVSVRAEYDEFHQNWDLSADQVAEVFAASFDSRGFARVAVESESLTQCIRLGATLMERASTARREATSLSARWVALGDHYTRQMRAWDDRGELLRVEPPGVEKQRFREEMIAELRAVRDELEPIVQTLVAELRALGAANIELVRWCEWVDRSSRDLLQQATTATLDQAPPVDTAGLSAALDALAGRWRGENVAEPPPATDGSAAEEPSPTARAHVAISQLAARARPWARVKTRPYDGDLYDELILSLSFSVTLPPTVSNVAIALQTVASLAADVARNADDDTFSRLVAQASTLEPLAVAVALLSSLKAVAEESDRSDASNTAARLRVDRLTNETWTDPEVWDANLFHCKTLLAMTVANTNEAAVCATVAAALPHLTPAHLLVAIAGWREQYATLDFQGAGHPMPYIGDLPGWLPQEGLSEMVRAAWDDLSEQDLDSDEVIRRLAAEYLDRAGGGLS